MAEPLHAPGAPPPGYYAAYPPPQRQQQQQQPPPPGPQMMPQQAAGTGHPQVQLQPPMQHQQPQPPAQGMYQPPGFTPGGVQGQGQGSPQGWGGGGVPPVPPTVEQRVAAEVSNLRSILATLMGALKVFTAEAAGHAQQVSMGDACELLGLVPTMLNQDPNIGRVRNLLYDSVPEGSPTVFTVLFEYLKADLRTAPGVQAPDERAAQIAQLRLAALKVLTKVISLSSLDHFPDAAATSQVSELCARAVVGEHGIERLLSIVCGGPSVDEAAKLAAMEALLALVVRNKAGRQALVDTHGSLLYLTTALRSEPSPIVRNFAAVCLRELASAFPSHVIQSELPELVVDLVRNDTSADVRECGMQILNTVFKADSSYVTRYPHKAELATLLHQLLEADTNSEVVDSACRLLSTVFCTEGRLLNDINHKDLPLDRLPQTFMAQWAERGGYLALLQTAAGRTGPRAERFASRAFRNFVQFCPHQLELGHRLLEHWKAVGVLLQVLRQQPDASAGAADAEARLIQQVELSIALALLFAQSPYFRTRMHRELSAFPDFMPVLRSAVTNHLKGAERRYYGGIDIYDITGHRLNSLQGVEWHADANGQPVARKASIRQIFQQQEQRLADRTAGTARSGLPAASTSYDEPAVQEQKQMLLTFVVLIYVVHLALSPGSTAAVQRQPQPQPQPHPAGRGESEASEAPSSESSPQGYGHPPPHHPAAQPQAYPPPPGPPHYPQQQQPPPRMPPGYEPALTPQPQGGYAAAAAAPPPPTHAPPPPQYYAAGGAGYPEATPTPGAAGPPGPAPTRTSLMRAQTAHPDRAQAELMRTMREAYPNETVASHNLPSQIDPRGSQLHAQAAGFAYDQPRMDSSRRPSAMSRGPSAPVGGASQYEPMFPTAGRVSPRAPVRPNPELQQTYSKFDNALRLTIHFAQYFNRKVEKKPTYKATPDGYMIRQTHIANPWTPVVKKSRLKTWNVKDLKEGDLFYFAVPFNEVSVGAVEEVLAKARRHSTQAKKMFLITPQKAKGRRWYLFDLLNNILPRIQDVLLELVKLLQNHGEENVKFPLFMFREQEMNEGERAVHPGNLLDIVDQVKFYFSQSPNDLVGVNSAYIKDLDERMRALSAREFTGYEDDLSTSSSSSSSVSSDDQDHPHNPPGSGYLGGPRGAPPPSGLPTGLASRPSATGAPPGADDSDSDTE